MTSESEGSTASFRALIQQAIAAYEIAVATNARVGQEAEGAHGHGLADLSAQEKAEAQRLKQAANSEESAGSAEAQRAGGVAARAERLKESATRLLDLASLAYVRGFSPGSVGAVVPRLAPDEAVAAAFAGAQLASIELNAALLNLAQAHIGQHEWAQARRILDPLRAELSGALLDDANSLLRTAYLEEAQAAADQHDWDRAREVAEAALNAGFPDGTLSSDPRWQQVAKYRPALMWRAIGASLLHEIGGHGQAVQAVAFAPDRGHLVSIDGADAKIWDITRENKVKLENLTPIPGAIALTPGGSLALCANGSLWGVQDGKDAGQVRLGSGQIVTNAFSIDASLIVVTERDVSQSWLMSEDSGYNKPAEYKLHRVGDRIPVPEEGILLRELQQYRRYRGNRRLPEIPSLTTQSQRITMKFVQSLKVHRLLDKLEICAAEADTCQIFLDVAISREAGLVASLSPTGRITVTDLKTKMTRHSFSIKELPTPLDSIFFSPAGDLLMVIVPREKEQSGVDCWDMSSGNRTWSCKVSGMVTDALFSPDGQIVAAITQAGLIHLLDVQRKAEASSIAQAGVSGHCCVAFSSDGSRLAAGGGTAVTIWGLPGQS